MKKTLKITAITLVLCMIVQLLSICATAEGTNNNQIQPEDAKQKPYIVSEIEQERSENEKHFILSDGKHVAASYAYPVHYKDADNNWRDIDNTPVSISDDDYGVVASNVDVTLSKKLKQNKTVRLNIDGYDVSWGFCGANNVSAITKANPQREGDDRFLMLDKTTSTTCYSNAFPNVDVEYTVSPTGVKENIILKSKYAQNNFQQVYKFTGLTATQKDSKTIELKNADGKVIYTVSAPIMIDGNNQTCENVSLQIIKLKNNQMTVSVNADAEWLNSMGRVYPVTVDPEVSSATISTAEFGTAGEGSGISENTNGYVGTHNYAGFPIDNMSVVRITDLPSIGAGGYVTSAELKLAFLSFSGLVGVYSADNVSDITSLSWSALTSLTPSGTADDITNTAESESFYSVAKWDVTRAAQKNYRSGLTFVLKSENDALSQIMTTAPFSVPTIVVTYINRNGISDKFSYHTQNVGRAGTAYVNDLTGRLEVSRTDMSYSSEKMSASIGMNFIANSREAVASGVATSDDTFKYNWRNSYYEYLDTGITSSAIYAIWQRGDGTQIYFNATQVVPESAEEASYYPAMNGYGYKLYSDYIEDESGIRYIFDDNSRLEKIQNGDDTTDAVTITYQPFNSDRSNFTCISRITDGDGKIYDFAYDSSFNLTSVSYKGTGTNTLDYVTYTYNANKQLTNVNHTNANHNDEISAYTYTSTGLISMITAPDGYKIAYEYENGTAGSAYNPRVSKITELATDSTPGNYMNITYDNNLTKYVDANGSEEKIIFDKDGNVATTMDENGYAVHQKSDASGNFLGSTSITVPTVNLLSNHSFESGTQNWTVYSTGSSTTDSDTSKAVFGAKSIKSARTTVGTVNLNQDFTNPAAGDYTLSAYVFADAVSDGNGAGAYAEVQLADGTWKSYYGDKIFGTSTDWERSSVSFNVPAGAQKLRAFLGINGATGTAYFDAAQLEKHKRAYDYNLVENSDFASGATSWSLTNATIGSDTRFHGGFDYNVISMSGSNSTASQSIAISGKKDDSYTFSAWVNALDTLPVLNSTSREMKMYVIGAKSDGTYKTLRSFTVNPNLQDKWYKLADSVILDDDYTTLSINIQVVGQQGTIYVDGVELSGGGFYDDSEPTEEDTSTEEPDDSTVEEPVEIKDDKGRVVSSTYNGVTTAYEYNGDTDDVTKTSVTTTIDGASQTIITASNSSKNETTKVRTDTNINSLGISTQTLTNTELGNILSVADGKNNSTAYEYDALQQLEELSALISSGNTASNAYEYEHDKIKEITHNGFEYQFNYNKFGDIESVYVGTQVLVSYGYVSNANRMTSSITFGNGAVINYVYDSDFNLIQTKNGDTVAQSYYYDEMGNVLKSTDHTLGTVTKQVKDETQVWNLAETSLLHSYKNDGDGFVEKIGSNTYTTTTGYNEETEASTVSYDGKVQTTTTDKFGRTSQVETKLGDTLISRQIYGYTTWTDSDGILRTSDQISYMSFASSSGTTYAENYTYDANGNLTTIKRGGDLIRSYAYDNINQLTGEYNYETLKYYQYNYDNAGNINSVTTLDMTYTPQTGITGMSYNSQQSYTYGDTNWKDKLTNFNGSDITYDAIGNPTSYNGATLEWTQGRQLNSIYGNLYSGGGICNYTYDASGLRTSKYYNGTTYNYTWVNGKITNQSWNGNNIHFYYDGDSIIGFNYNGASYTYIKNIQGDVVSIADSTGTIVANYTYDAWGKILSATGSMASINSIRYRSYYYDDEIGMYYLQSRYYDPSLRRFINEDENIDTGSGALGANMFAYCNNSPIVKYDPNGQDAILVFNERGAHFAGVMLGHVGLLFEAHGSWFYFSVGGGDDNNYSALIRDVAYLGHSNINVSSVSKINALIEKADETHNITIGGKYTSMYYIEGDFSKILSYIDELYMHPQVYDVALNNCLHIASYMLSLGTLTGTYKNEYAYAIYCLRLMTIPNSAERGMNFFVKNIESYHALKWYQKPFAQDPYCYFYDMSYYVDWYGYY